MFGVVEDCGTGLVAFDVAERLAGDGVDVDVVGGPEDAETADVVEIWGGLGGGNGIVVRVWLTFSDWSREVHLDGELLELVAGVQTWCCLEGDGRSGGRGEKGSSSGERCGLHCELECVG